MKYLTEDNLQNIETLLTRITLSLASDNEVDEESFLKVHSDACLMLAEIRSLRECLEIAVARGRMI